MSCRVFYVAIDSQNLFIHLKFIPKFFVGDQTLQTRFMSITVFTTFVNDCGRQTEESVHGEFILFFAFMLSQ